MPGDHAEQDRGEEHVAARIFDVLRERADAVEAHVSQHGDGGSGADERPGEGGRGIVEKGWREKSTPTPESRTMYAIAVTKKAISTANIPRVGKCWSGR